MPSISPHLLKFALLSNFHLHTVMALQHLIVEEYEWKEEEFKEYADKAKSLPPATKDADKLILYGLYKQATVGSVNTNRPGFFSPTERAKWDAWKAVEGKSKEEAMTEYIAKVKQLQQVEGAASTT